MYQKRYPILLIYIGLIGKIDCWTSNYELKVRRLSSDHNIRDHNSMNIYSYIGIMNINTKEQAKWVGKPMNGESEESKQSAGERVTSVNKQTNLVACQKKAIICD